MVDYIQMFNFHLFRLLKYDWNPLTGYFHSSHTSIYKFFLLLIIPVCSVYTEAIKSNQPPHIVFDTTITNVASETVKSLTSALGLPTVSASFGQEGDIRQWRDLTDQKRQYLLQVMPPSDIIPEVIRSIIVYMNITNAAILYDESFGKPNTYDFPLFPF